MVEINKLVVLPDNKGIYLEASIPDYTYFSNVYLGKISIDTQDTYSSTGVSTNPIYTKTLDSNTKSIQITIPMTDLLVSTIGTLFFVYVEATGTPGSDTPCGQDETTTLKVITDLTCEYQKVYSFINEFNNVCAIPKGFIDYILKLKYFQMSLDNGDYQQAINFWNKFFLNKEISLSTNKCSCNG